MEVVVLDELVQVDREEFKRDYQVVSEHAMVLNLNYVVLVFGVLLLQVLKDAQLNTSLVLVSLLVLYYLDCDNLPSLVIQALESLAEASFSEEIEHFKSVVNMVFEDDLVIAIFIVVSRIVQLGTRFAFNFVCFETEEVDFLEVEQLSLLKVRQLARLRVQLQCLTHRHRVLYDLFHDRVLHRFRCFLLRGSILAMIAHPPRRLLLSQVCALQQ